MRINPKKLILAMYDRDLSVVQLSALSGVSRVTISNIKSGKSCSVETRNKIAKALEVEPESLLEVYPCKKQL